MVPQVIKGCIKGSNVELEKLHGKLGLFLLCILDTPVLQMGVQIYYSSYRKILVNKVFGMDDFSHNIHKCLLKQLVDT